MSGPDPERRTVFAHVTATGKLSLTHGGLRTTTEHPTSAAAREAAVACAVDIAVAQGGAVELVTSGVEGEWRLGVGPDGSVTARPIESGTTEPVPAVLVPDLPAKVSSTPDLSVAPTASVEPRPSTAAVAAPDHTELEHTVIPAPSSSRVEDPDDAEASLERTVIRSRRERLRVHTATLYASTGVVIEIEGSGVLGRRPTGTENAVRIDDPARSISNTHLHFVVEEDGIIVTDLDSSNGTSVTRDGVETACEPGVEVRAERGARVQVGDQFFVVV